MTTSSATGFDVDAIETTHDDDEDDAADIEAGK